LTWGSVVSDSIWGSGVSVSKSGVADFGVSDSRSVLISSTTER
jgi:hypothetical protein